MAPGHLREEKKKIKENKMWSLKKKVKIALYGALIYWLGGLGYASWKSVQHHSQAEQRADINHNGLEPDEAINAYKSIGLNGEQIFARLNYDDCRFARLFRSAMQQPDLREICLDNVKDFIDYKFEEERWGYVATGYFHIMKRGLMEEKLARKLSDRDDIPGISMEEAEAAYHLAFKQTERLDGLSFDIFEEPTPHREGMSQHLKFALLPFKLAELDSASNLGRYLRQEEKK